MERKGIEDKVIKNFIFDVFLCNGKLFWRFYYAIKATDMSMRFGSITKGIIEWNLDMQNGQNKKY